MRKIVICVTFILLLNNQINADEINLSEYKDDTSNIYMSISKHTFLEVSFRLFFPPNNDANFSFLNIGYGWNYDIVKNIFSPGISFDVSIGTDWLRLFAEDKNEDKKNEPSYTQFGLGAGIKIYNMFEIYEFRIIPFAGCNFLLLYKPCPMFGLSLSFSFFGLEYAYYFPLGSYKPEANHHIAIKFIAKDFF